MKKTLCAILVIAIAVAMFAAIPVTSSATLLPKEYVQLEYAESDGTQLIYTNIITDPKLRVECDFQIVDPYNTLGSSGVAGVVGAYWSGSKTPGRFQFGCSRTGSYFSLGMGSLLVNSMNLSKCTSDPAIDFELFEKDDKRHQIIMDAMAGTITFDGKVVGQKADLGMIDKNDTDNGANLAPIVLFGTNNAVGNDTYKANGVSASRIYSCKFYLDNVLIADFVPCYRVSDYYVGMYELVEGKFYINGLYEDISLLGDPAVVPTTAAPTTEAPKTTAPVVTTAAPVVTTETPKTEAPKTEAPVITGAPTTEPTAEKKGCGGSIAVAGVAVVMTLGCAVIRRKKH